MIKFPARWLSFTACIFDICAVALAWICAYIIRFNGEVPFDFMAGGLCALIWIVPIYSIMFHLFGLYRGMWIFASLPDLVRIAKAIVTGALIAMISSVIIQPLPIIPRSVLLVSPMLLFLSMGGARAIYRAAKELYLYGGLVSQGKPVLVLGAGNAGASIVRELQRSGEWRLIGLLDDDPDKRGRELYGYQIFGSISDLQFLANELRVEHVIIAIPSASSQSHRRIVTICVRAGVRALVLPKLTTLTQGQAWLSMVRQINLEDLLGREPVFIDALHIESLLKKRVVMVTGAGGSIGSELCRQILRFKPMQLVAVDISEYATYRLGEELHAKYAEVPLIVLVGDIKDSLFIDQVMSRYMPHIVFHAAAYKHVPLMEELNTWQAVRNNALGTYCVARAAIQYGVHRFVLISTDKAVNSTSVMGASKRIAEMVCQALQQETKITKLETVRFGNVLGSAGSVIPKFQNQIASGGPVTVTHPEITRFFMTISEASQLVLQASIMGQGGEIFLLDMGQPVRIVDLARDLIHLYGFSEEQIKIVFTGLRPGEKLYEELLADEETTTLTPHLKLKIAKAREVPENLLDTLVPWLMQHRVPPDDEVRRDLYRWVPEYRPMLRIQLNSLQIDHTNKVSS
ncbi:polysaccharide biosynthesis protein [Candidatus Vallotia cooleyia]|uniref:polysaccharide biosynthesis protein n=1 Tax=Candidatus Vallotiella adelgis TaxID=1177211 RepID=UPI001D02822A|nr:nucleoside-diphosphate sugar epimerase/dehydratase [Candidatus Vallotia cooleyia]UDG82437.1 UDP-N-acetyl-alpha-D-glucosamine C6 dehydratase [Candidatus Vallotia cooleyia]